MLSLSGDVYLQRANQTLRLNRDDRFRAADEIEVRNVGRAIVVLGDSYLFELGANTRMQVDVPGGDDDLIPPKVTLRKGTLRVQSLKRPKTERDAAEVRLGAMRVLLGTEDFWASVTEKGVTACAVKGEMSVTSFEAEPRDLPGQNNCQYLAAGEQSNGGNLLAPESEDPGSIEEFDKAEASRENLGEETRQSISAPVQPLKQPAESPKQSTDDRYFIVFASSTDRSQAQQRALQFANRLGVSPASVEVISVSVDGNERYRIGVAADDGSLKAQMARLRASLGIADIWAYSR